MVWHICRKWKAPVTPVFWKRVGKNIYLAELDLDHLRKYRKSEVHGNAYRRPEKYGVLTSAEIREPFIRSDRR